MLVTHEWGDDESTLIEDAVNGLYDFQKAAGLRKNPKDWLAVERSGTTEVERGRTYNAALATLRRAARSSDAVIAWGNLLTGPVLTVAPEFPRVRFGLVSSVYVDRLPPNVLEASFHVEEEAFLAGVAAAMMSETRTVGYIGAVESIPRRIGFVAGAYYANPNVRVLMDDVGFSTTLGWNGPSTIAAWIGQGSFEPAAHDTRQAEEVALSQFDRGADVIYAAAAASNPGVYEAAAVRGRWVIGGGGARSGPTPPRWQRQTFAVIGERAELATPLLASQLIGGSIKTQHIFWGLTYPGYPIATIGYQTSKQQFERIRPYLNALIHEIGLHRVKVPFNNPQLADFIKEFPR